MSLIRAATATVDVRRQQCPYPLLMIKKALDGLREGDVLEAQTDHLPTARETTPRFCKDMGYGLDVLEEAGLWRLIITKGQEAPKPVSLTLDGVEKSYASDRGLVTAVEQIDLQILEGEFVCIVGPSGCGKSTLLNLIAGLERPDRGAVKIKGHEVTGPGSDRVVIFQEGALFPWLTVRQNVEFGLKIKGVERRVRRDLAMDYLKMVHLTRFADALVHELSGGMKQRVASARGLAMDPDILLMDEPFAALDAQTRDLLHVELQEIWTATSKTILFITHNVREAVCLANRVLVMTYRPGRIKETFIIGHHRPRHLEDPGLIETSALILKTLKGEVDKAVKAELGDA
ncbi:MAG: ATP-binding cassette domain-containing protein [Nitrospiria bacterium]